MAGRVSATTCAHDGLDAESGGARIIDDGCRAMDLNTTRTDDQNSTLG